MLVLTRKPGQSVYIGDDIKVTLQAIRGNQVRLGVEAPSWVRIYREEIYLQILEENRSAAASAESADSGLEGMAKAFKERKGGPGIARVPGKVSRPRSEFDDEE